MVSRQRVGDREYSVSMQVGQLLKGGATVLSSCVPEKSPVAAHARETGLPLNLVEAPVPGVQSSGRSETGLVREANVSHNRFNIWSK